MVYKITSFFRRFVLIRPQERVKTFIMSFYFFAIIMTVWMLKPVRNSLFLDELGAGNLRYVYMGEGLFLMAVVWAFIQFSKRVSRKALYNGVLLFFIACLIGFWFFFRTQIPFLSAFFYIWASSYSIVMTTQFFTLANDIFNPLEAKRLFGFILSAGSIGGVLGGISTQHLVGVVGTENLLLIIAGIIGLCNVAVMFFWNRLMPAETPEKKSAAATKKEKGLPAEEKSLTSARQLLLRSSYLMMLLGLVMIAKISSTVVDNQFNAVVELGIEGKDARTAFYGGFFGALNAVSFVMQFFVTGFILRFFGVGIALWILPLGLMAGGVGTVFYPILLTGIFFKAFDGSVNYSVQQASREVLYLPVSSEVRYRVKPINDMLGYRVAKSLGGVYIAVAAPFFGLQDRSLGVLVLALLPFWFLMAWKMRQGYSALLRGNLTKTPSGLKRPSTQRAVDVLTAKFDNQTIESMKSFLRHPSAYDRKLAAVAYSFYISAGKNADASRKKIEEIIKLEAPTSGEMVTKSLLDKEMGHLEETLLREANLSMSKGKKSSDDFLKDFPEDALIKLGEIVRDPNKDLESKRRAIRIMGVIAKQETVDLLVSCLSNNNNHGQRFLIVKALNRLHDRNGSLSINRFLMKGELTKEVALFLSLANLKTYHSHHVKEKAEENFSGIILNALMDESMERLFLFLDLLYPQEMIQIIYDRITEHQEGDPMRSDAIELLNNTLEPDLLMLVQPVFEDESLRRVSKQEAVKIVKGLADSRDHWLVLIGRMLIDDLDLRQHDRSLSGLS